MHLIMYVHVVLDGWNRRVARWVIATYAPTEVALDANGTRAEAFN